MITTDYDGWIITLPLATERQLFPSFSDGADVRASVARFNAKFRESVEKQLNGAWINQETRHTCEICSPNDWIEKEIQVQETITDLWNITYAYGDWYVS